MADFGAGDIIRFKYKDRDSKIEMKEAYVLNKEHEGYLHGLKTKELSDNDMKNICKLVKEFNRPKIRNLVYDGTFSKYWHIDNPKDFYYDELKELFVKQPIPYRTYDVRNMRGIKKIDNKIKEQLDAEIEDMIDEYTEQQKEEL